MIETANHLGFVIENEALVGNILVPRYYDPEVPARLKALATTHDLLNFGKLIDEGHVTAATGHEIGKMAYGTGVIPFIRTSDISSWELKFDPKQGVSKDVYDEFAPKQDVRPGDILFVRDGTYLIGSACLVSSHDVPMLYQSHILRFRVGDGAPLSAPLLLAALSSPIARRQIRSKQFTADIIDTIGNRYRELVLPIPKDDSARSQIEQEVRALTDERTVLREKLRKLPHYAQGELKELGDELRQSDLSDPDEGTIGFLLPSSGIRNGIFLPRYYNPTLEEELTKLKATHDLVTVGDLVKRRVVELKTGIEPGKMAYGLGEVPFIRTSDITNWELKADPKQGLSEELYLSTRAKLDVQADDILLVRDGTYLVGTSAILTQEDTRIVYCGGIYKMRLTDKEELDPYLLFALLNSPIVRRQMRSKQFTRDVIDTIGKRILEVSLPIPRDPARRKLVERDTRATIQRRVLLRDRLKDIALELEGAIESVEDLAEVPKGL